jgi:hypothetical protein
MKKEKIDRHKKTTQRNLNLTRKHCRNTDTDGKKQTGTKKELKIETKIRCKIRDEILYTHKFLFYLFLLELKFLFRLYGYLN